MNCPFYGRHMLIWPDLDQPETLAPFHLIDQHGNECALIIGAYSPCAEEITGRPVDWHTCVIVQQGLFLG
jgi:hypothetical protein